MTAYVGIDVAKRKHQVMVMDASGDCLVKAFPVTNDRTGIDALLDRLAGLDEAVEIGLEATGHYWLALFEQLTIAGYTVHVLNPLQVHAYQRSGIRRRKTDTIDAEWIADFVRIGGARESVDPQTLPVYHELRQLSRFRFSLVDQIGDAKRRLLAVLDRVFPEYERFFSSVFITTSRELLKEAATAQDFADFDLHELTTLLNKASRGRFGEDEAHALQQAALDVVAFQLHAAHPFLLMKMLVGLDEIIATPHGVELIGRLRLGYEVRHVGHHRGRPPADLLAQPGDPLGHLNDAVQVDLLLAG
jgi:transposase